MTVTRVAEPSRVIHVQETPESPQVEGIRDAYHRGVFKPYEDALNVFVFPGSDCTWMSDIIKIVKGTYTAEPDLLISNQLLCYLFTLAVDPKIPENTKRDLINKVQSSLTPQQLSSLQYALLTETCSTLGVHILRYCDLEMWKCGVDFLQQSDDIRSIPKTLFGLMREVCDNSWLAEEKQHFLSRLFETLPFDLGTQTLYYFLLHASHSELSQFKGVGSPILLKRVADLNATRDNFGTKVLDQVAKHSTPIKIPFEGLAREYFLKWLFKEHRLNKNMDLFAIHFQMEDWMLLCEDTYEQSPRFFDVMVAMCDRWIASVANRLGNGTLHYEHDQALETSLWTFFHYTSKIMGADKEMFDFTKKSLDAICKQFTERHLYLFYGALEGALPSRVLGRLVETDPDKFAAWMFVLFASDNRVLQITIFSKIFQQLIQNRLLGKAIDILFESDRDPHTKFRIYSILNDDQRRIVWQHLKQNTAAMNDLTVSANHLMKEKELLQPAETKAIQDFQAWRSIPVSG